MEQDAETDLGHAQYRQFTLVEGRWTFPGPDSGSYDLTNLPSFHRYAGRNLSTQPPMRVHCVHLKIGI
ncbi:MAG TPA: hypothetical protein VHX63_05175 [Acidobacteriaceae bacterium]|jgi:hypothetical protein|nr:hypothetical protein [Acidobacteriaceae bacterium]